MSKFNLGIKACGVFLLWAAAAVALPAQITTAAPPVPIFTTLHTFDGTDGANPYAGLVQGTDGDLYGTTDNGGTNGIGTVFTITPSGTVTTLYNFCSQPNCADGYGPLGGLVQATDGNFYGTTLAGGGDMLCDYGYGCGTVFKITPSGKLTTLHIFDGTDGAQPFAGLIAGTDGNFYGTTQYGGINNDGTVFTITPSGVLTVLYSFCHQRNCTDGKQPAAALVQSADGNFYGTTVEGGPYANCNNGNITTCGTVFKITTSGKLTTLYSFGGTDGGEPNTALAQGTDGNFYGTTGFGGDNSCRGQGCGTVFKITPRGRLTTLHSFDGTDGANPYGGLVHGTDGNFYGTTYNLGANAGCDLRKDCGTVFKITPSGTLTTLHSFCSERHCTHGYAPEAGLIQTTDGSFYGTTYFGGASGRSSAGTVFSLSVGLGPFVETQPTSGVVGKYVRILGTNLTGATNVRFNGIESKFTIVSASEIITTVPKGATTGPVRVITPAGKLKSNVPFRVK
jgi:uncharacterized repeat protein (TIGR03803 family)